MVLALPHWRACAESGTKVDWRALLYSVFYKFWDHTSFFLESAFILGKYPSVRAARMSTTLPRWSRSSPKLSPEIYDIIINNLHNSKADLITSSTVCKLWLSLSWYHLFGEVNYRPDFAKHLATSTHAMSAIAPYIRKVGLKGPVSGYGEMNILAESILCLPSLRELHIERASWDKLGENMTFPHPTSVDSAFHRITRIFFKSVRFSSFSTLSYFLDLFSALEELCLENVSWDDLGTASDGVVGAAKSKHSSLKKLRITFCHNRVVLNWLHYGVISDTSQGPSTILNSRQYPRLRRLSLPDVLPGESDILGTFLAGLGESLENLEVGILVDSLDVRTTGGQPLKPLLSLMIIMLTISIVLL